MAQATKPDRVRHSTCAVHHIAQIPILQQHSVKRQHAMNTELHPKRATPAQLRQPDSFVVHDSYRRETTHRRSGGHHSSVGAPLSDVRSEVNNTYAQYQAAIREWRTRLQGLQSDEPGYTDAFDQLTSATEALLTFEQQIPAILDQPVQEASLRIVTWTSRIQAVVVLGIGLTLIPGWISWPWLLLLGGQAVAVALIWPKQGSVARHDDLRFAAIALNVVAVLNAVIIFHVVSGWFTVLSGLGLIFICGLASDANLPKGGKA